MNGKFITIDGIEGAGKSTQIKLMTEFLRGTGKNVLITREPGGTDFGEKIRDILLDEKTGKLDARTELLMMFAARNEHIKQKIQPALNSGLWVISDRFTDSSYAYQGGGRGLDFAKIRDLEKWTLGEFEPDLSLFLNISIKTSNKRLQHRGKKDRFEKENNDFFTKVYNGYQQRLAQNPDRIKNIDASGNIKSTFIKIQQHLNKIL